MSIQGFEPTHPGFTVTYFPPDKKAWKRNKVVEVLWNLSNRWSLKKTTTKVYVSQRKRQLKKTGLRNELTKDVKNAESANTCRLLLSLKFIVPKCCDVTAAAAPCSGVMVRVWLPGVDELVEPVLLHTEWGKLPGEGDMAEMLALFCLKSGEHSPGFSEASAATEWNEYIPSINFFDFKGH